MNAVESLLTRLQIAEVIPAFKANGVDKVVTLRSLTPEQLEKLIPDSAQRTKLQEALKRNSVEAPSPAGTVAPQRVVAGAPTPAIPPPRYMEDEGDHRVAGAGNQQKICRFYRTPQGCKKGDKCNLIHSDQGPGPAAGGDRMGGDRVGGGARQMGRRPCREFLTTGCRYGDDCKYAHEQPGDGSAEPITHATKEGFEATLTIPSEAVKLLLGQKAAKLNEINRKYETTNSRIQRPENYHVQFSFTLFSTKSQAVVDAAKSEIERLVGIKREQDIEARFQYQLNEYDRNVSSVQHLAAGNIRNKGTPMELPESILKKIVGLFRFERTSDNIRQLWALSDHTDREKYEVVSKFVKHMPGLQAIIFTSKERVEEMEKRKQYLTHQFPVTPQFVHRGLTKEERMKALDAFKKGETASDGTLCRLLVTTDDYAKLARKIVIPFVNFIIHFNVPKTKELYLARILCTGRKGNKGMSLMFVNHHDAQTQREWSEVLPLEEVKSMETDANIAAIVAPLVFDSEKKSLTTEDADPPSNWREQLNEKKPRYQSGKH